MLIRLMDPLENAISLAFSLLTAEKEFVAKKLKDHNRMILTLWILL